MKKVLLTSAIIASLGTAAVAQGIAPVATTSTQGSAGLSVGALSQSQIIALAAALGISVAVLVSVLDDEADAT